MASDGWVDATADLADATLLQVTTGSCLYFITAANKPTGLQAEEAALENAHCLRNYEFMGYSPPVAGMKTFVKSDSGTTRLRTGTM